MGTSPVISFKEIKTSFFDELQKYEDLSEGNFKAKEKVAQLSKVIVLAEEEIAKNGSHAAFNWYGWNLVNGHHCFPIKVDEGIELLEKAMGMGSMYALSYLADIYSGLVENAQEEKYQKPERAVHYYTKASKEHNDGEASYRLACLYLEGTIIKKDVAKALEFGERSNHQGNAYGNYLWASWLFNGDMLAQNQAEAYELFCQTLEIATDVQYTDCYDLWLSSTLKYWIGYCLFHGEGVSQDKDTGYKMICEAVDSGNVDAQKWLEEYTYHRRVYETMT